MIVNGDKILWGFTRNAGKLGDAKVLELVVLVNFRVQILVESLQPKTAVLAGPRCKLTDTDLTLLKNTTTIFNLVSKTLI